MNRVELIGRLTKEPDVRYTNDGKCVARYTLAVDRRGKDNVADFISCVAFDKTGEFAEKYMRKGNRYGVTGSIRTGSYEKDGRKVYTTDVAVDAQYFCESAKQAEKQADDFEAVPDNVQDDLPFV